MGQDDGAGFPALASLPTSAAAAGIVQAYVARARITSLDDAIDVLLHPVLLLGHVSTS